MVPPDEGTFQVEWSVIGSEAVVRLSGELDFAASQDFEQAIMAASGPGRTIIIDLSRLQVISSSGLRQIAKAFQRQRDAGGDLVLRHPTAQTKRVLEIVGLSQVLRIVA